MVILNTSKLLNQTLENLYFNKTLSLAEASSGNFKFKVLLKPKTKFNLTNYFLLLPKVAYSITLGPKFTPKFREETKTSDDMISTLFIELRGYDQEVLYSLPKEDYDISYHLIKQYD